VDLKCVLQTGELEVCIFLCVILSKPTGCVVLFSSLRQTLADLHD